MKKVYLDSSDWTLKSDKIGQIRSTVPGCVHTDLANNKLIPDMFFRDNNKDLQWIENENWEYSLSFTVAKENAYSIVFEGIDTYSEIYLNGTLIGKTDNMFISHEFEIASVINDGLNTLTVKLLSPIKQVENMPQRRGAFTTERINSRRMQCTYGWDWVDRFVTCGIFRSVYIKYVDGMYLTDAFVATDFIDKFGAQIRCELEFDNYSAGDTVNVAVVSPDGDTLLTDSFYVREDYALRRYDIAQPKLWYPAGYGEQPLYKLVISVGDSTSEVTFGIRTLRIVQLIDGENSEYSLKATEMRKTPMGAKFDKNTVSSGFKVVVNEKEIYCKGGDWVPCEPFPSAETKEKYEKLILTALSMNLNFLRIWGGGIFESDELYSLCDKYGILVAQDFLLACGTYPEKEDWFISAMQKEAVYGVKKLRNHPCLAWYHGDNENAFMGSELKSDFTGRDGSLHGTAPAIYRFDKSRNFLLSSPYGGDMYASVTRGTSHSTNFCGEIFTWAVNTDGSDFKEYLENFVPRFESEAPTLGMVNENSLKQMMSESDIYADESEEMIVYHTKNNPGLNLTIYGVLKSLAESYLGTFGDVNDKLFKLRFLQYEWVRVVFESVKRNIGYNNGIVFWMYNDCWPASTGWAFVDYYCRPKASYYSFKRCGAPLLPSVTFIDGKCTYCLTNDILEDKECVVTARLLDISKNFREVDSCDFTVTVKGYSTAKHTLPNWENSENMLIVCETTGKDFSEKCFYKKGNLTVTKCDNITVTEITDNSITVKANGYVHVVELCGDCIFADNYFILNDGEQRTVNFKSLSAGKITVNAYTLKA